MDFNWLDAKIDVTIAELKIKQAQLKQANKKLKKLESFEKTLMEYFDKLGKAVTYAVQDAITPDLVKVRDNVLEQKRIVQRFKKRVGDLCTAHKILGEYRSEQIRLSIENT